MDREGRSQPSEPVGDSPGEPFDMPPDEPAAVDRSGTTAEEQGERSLERRLAMEEPDASVRRRSTSSPPSAGPVLDDDVAPDVLVTEDPGLDPEEADLDRTEEEVGELSSDSAESAEEAALHIERE
jgi:hypothetical protein